MKILALMLFFATSLLAQFGSSPIQFVSTSPVGNACGSAYLPLQYVTTTGVIAGCVSGTWTAVGGGGGGGGITDNCAANGWMVRTALNNAICRSFVQGPGILISNLTGVGGNPTFQLDTGFAPILAGPNSYSGTQDFLNSVLALNTGGLFATNAQTSTYSITAADFLQCKTITIASGTFTLTLPSTIPATGQCVDVINYGTGVPTLARGGHTINGAAADLTGTAGSSTAPTGWHVVSNGADYVASKWLGSGGGGGSSPLTTKGDLYTYSTVDARLPVGTNGQVLTADSAQATGIKWATPSAGTHTDKMFIPSAGCSPGITNAIAGRGWNFNGIQSTCATGSYSGFQLVDTGTNDFYYTTQLPDTWTGTIDITALMVNPNTSTGTLRLLVSTSCFASGDSYSLSYNASQNLDIATAGSFHYMSGTLTGLTTTGCSAGKYLVIKFVRDNSFGSNPAGTFYFLGMTMPIQWT